MENQAVKLWKRVTSRKFLLAVAAFLTAIANGQPEFAVGVVIAYIGGESYIDRGYANVSQEQNLFASFENPAETSDDLL